MTGTTMSWFQCQHCHVLIQDKVKFLRHLARHDRDRQDVGLFETESGMVTIDYFGHGRGRRLFHPKVMLTDIVSITNRSKVRFKSPVVMLKKLNRRQILEVVQDAASIFDSRAPKADAVEDSASISDSCAPKSKAKDTASISICSPRANVTKDTASISDSCTSKSKVRKDTASISDSWTSNPKVRKDTASIFDSCTSKAKARKGSASISDSCTSKPKVRKDTASISDSCTSKPKVRKDTASISPKRSPKAKGTARVSDLRAPKAKVKNTASIRAQKAKVQNTASISNSASPRADVAKDTASISEVCALCHQPNCTSRHSLMEYVHGTGIVLKCFRCSQEFFNTMLLKEHFTTCVGPVQVQEAPVEQNPTLGAMMSPTKPRVFDLEITLINAADSVVDAAELAPEPCHQRTASPEVTILPPTALVHPRVQAVDPGQGDMVTSFRPPTSVHDNTITMHSTQPSINPTQSVLIDYSNPSQIQQHTLNVTRTNQLSFSETSQIQQILIPNQVPAQISPSSDRVAACYLCRYHFPTEELQHHLQNYCIPSLHKQTVAQLSPTENSLVDNILSSQLYLHDIQQPHQLTHQQPPLPHHPQTFVLHHLPPQEYNSFAYQAPPPPQQHHASPQQHHASSQQYHASPQQHHASPQQHHAPPQEQYINSGPFGYTQQQSPPQRHFEPPSQHHFEPPPQHHFEPPPPPPYYLHTAPPESTSVIHYFPQQEQQTGGSNEAFSFGGSAPPTYQPPSWAPTSESVVQLSDFCTQTLYELTPSAGLPQVEIMGMGMSGGAVWQEAPPPAAQGVSIGYAQIPRNASALPPRFVCSVCGTVFQDVGNFEMHMREAHGMNDVRMRLVEAPQNDVQNRVNDQGPGAGGAENMNALVCRDCEQLVLHADMQDHVKSCRGKARAAPAPAPEAHAPAIKNCEVCGIRVHWLNMVDHLKECGRQKQKPIKPKQPESYPCSQCNKTFKTLGNARRHIALAHAQTNFVCHFCPMTCKTLRMLEKHQKEACPGKDPLKSEPQEILGA